MNIKDKVVVKIKNKKLFFPAHCLPHKLPFTKPITNESCHYHKSKFRMMHHRPFCFLFCKKNYEVMIKEYKKSRVKN